MIDLFVKPQALIYYWLFLYISCKSFLNDNRSHCYCFICTGSSSFWWWQSQAAFGESEEGSISHSTFCLPRVSESAKGDDWGQSRTPADGKPAYWPKVKAVTWKVKVGTVVKCYTCIEYCGIVNIPCGLIFTHFIGILHPFILILNIFLNLIFIN